jgi:phage-related tail fiber protein
LISPSRIAGAGAAALAALVNSSPAALDTLNELTAALGNDPNFATTVTNALALKAPLAFEATALPKTDEKTLERIALGVLRMGGRRQLRLFVSRDEGLDFSA